MSDENEEEERWYIAHSQQTCHDCGTKFLRVDGKCPKCFPPTTDVYGEPLEQEDKLQ